MKFRAGYISHLKRVGQIYPTVLLCLIVAALLIRFTIRDQFPIVSVVYYATPLLVSMGLSIFACLVLLARCCWWRGSVSLALAAICALGWHASAYVYHETQIGSPAAKIVFWNAGRGLFGWSGVTTTLRAFDADLIGLVEAGSSDPKMEQYWRESFPAYQVIGPNSGLVLLARGKMTRRDAGLLGQGGRYCRYEVHLSGRAVDVLLVDIKSNPLRSRREAFGKLLELIDQLSDRPLLVMGDFNTPLDSVFFDPLRERLTNAFHYCGNGYDATWPSLFPMLSLDQVWANSQIQLHSCEFPWTWHSDHRPVLTMLQ